MAIFRSIMPIAAALAFLFAASSSANSAPVLLSSERILAVSADSTGDLSKTTYAKDLLDLVNAERVIVGVPPLCMNSKLKEAALRHASDMASHDFVRSSGFDDSTALSRLHDEGFNYSAVGETVAAGQTNASGVVGAWMGSPDHKSILLSKLFKFFGAGYAFNDATTHVHFWTQDFAAGYEGERMAPSTDEAGRRRMSALRRKLQRKLELLGCCVLPVAVDEASQLSWTQCAAVVLWLEDRAIRHDPIEERLALRQASTPGAWVEAVVMYLRRVGCPVTLTCTTSDECEWGEPVSDHEGALTVLLWLAGRAVTLHFEENADRINSELATNHPEKHTPFRPKTDSEECSPELIQAVEGIARAAGITWNPTQGLQVSHLAALNKLLASKLGTDNDDNNKDNVADQSVELTRAIERLRLIYINDLKELQLAANRILAKAQEFTANPKTDTCLGKTGF